MATGRNSSRQPVRRQPSAHYIYGNTVRKAEVYPKPERREERRKQAHTVSRQVQKNRKQALHISRAYVVFLAISAILALGVCVWYLQIRAEMASRSAHIGTLQQELADLKEENTSRYNAIMDSVNMEDVKSRAAELGMVPAGPDQIVVYQNPISDYVKQYADIPESGVLAQSEKLTK